MKNRLLSVLAIVAILFLNACKDDEKKLPANVIQDADGVEIELTWDTGGSADQAVVDADLDLFLFEEDATSPTDYSTSDDSFEDVDLDEDSDDDEYTIIVMLYENIAGEDVDFTVTVSGGDKEIEVEGSFSSTDGPETLATVLTIKKEGNKYTVEEED